MITIRGGERVEVARTTGRVLRVHHEVLSGSVTFVGSALVCSREDAWHSGRWGNRSREVCDWLMNRVDEDLSVGRIASNRARELRNAARNGSFYELPSAILDDFSAYLGQEPLEITLDTNASRTIVLAPHGPMNRHYITVISVQAVGGPDLSEINILGAVSGPGGPEVTVADVEAY